MEIEFNNPPKDIAKRASCGIKSPHYEIMMNLLHHDAQKMPRLYYCGPCHSIETVSTYITHKSNENCQIYTRGQILGTTKVFNLFNS